MRIVESALRSYRSHIAVACECGMVMIVAARAKDTRIRCPKCGARSDLDQLVEDLCGTEPTRRAEP